MAARAQPAARGSRSQTRSRLRRARAFTPAFPHRDAKGTVAFPSRPAKISVVGQSAGDESVVIFLGGRSSSMNYYADVCQTDFPCPWMRGEIAGRMREIVEQTIVGYVGRILAQADPGPEDKVVVAPTDIAVLLAECSRRTGNDMRARRRGEVHGCLGRHWLARGGAKSLAMDVIEG
jgi:hypothetical protein